MKKQEPTQAVPEDRLEAPIGSQAEEIGVAVKKGLIPLEPKQPRPLSLDESVKLPKVRELQHVNPGPARYLSLAG
jgi:hypothetical protein